MSGLFNVKMSSVEAQTVLFNYAASHRGENIEDIKEEYRRVASEIMERELSQNRDVLTSYHIE